MRLDLQFADSLQPGWMIMLGQQNIICKEIRENDIQNKYLQKINVSSF